MDWLFRQLVLTIFSRVIPGKWLNPPSSLVFPRSNQCHLRMVHPKVSCLASCLDILIYSQNQNWIPTRSVCGYYKYVHNQMLNLCVQKPCALEIWKFHINFTVYFRFHFVWCPAVTSIAMCCLKHTGINIELTLVWALMLVKGCLVYRKTW